MATAPKRWYPVNRLGKLVTTLYALLPPYIVCAQVLDAFPGVLQIPIIGGLAATVLCLLYAKFTGKKIFERKHDKREGFTLIELLMVIAIIGLLAAIIFPAFAASRQKAYYARSLQEFRSIYTALQMYSLDNQNQYPPDASRGLPPGAEKYIAGGVWPAAPYPGSVYDWDSWAAGDLVDTSVPPKQVYQISIRFCTAAGVCTIPNEKWAAGFGVDSALYYCIQGPCRAHASEPISYPGYCVNC